MSSESVAPPDGLVGRQHVLALAAGAFAAQAQTAAPATSGAAIAGTADVDTDRRL